MKSARSLRPDIFARPWHSRRVAGVGCDNAAKLAVAADRAVTDGPEIDLQHIVPYVPSTMWALGVVMAHPGPQDVIELRAAETDEEIQTFALDGRDERFREGICVERPVRDLDDPSTFRIFRAADGYFAADQTSFWGCKIG